MKIQIIVVLIGLLSIAGRAQQRIQIFGGVNLSDYRFPENPYDFNKLYFPTLGIHFGLFTDIPLGIKWFLRPQVQFIQRGSFYDNAHINVERKTSLIYAELPLLLGYQISKPFSIAIGPSVGYVLYACNTSDGETEKLEHFPENKFDFGISSSFGWQASERWAFLVNYYFGLSAIHSYDVFHTQTYQIMPVSFANVVFQLSGAYRFPARNQLKQER